MIDSTLSTRGVAYSEIQKMAEDLMFEGYDCMQLLGKILDFYVAQPTKNVSDLKKAQISELIAQADFTLIQGGNEELNMLNTLSGIAQVLAQKK